MFSALAAPEPASAPVAIDRYFEVSLYLMLVTGFGTLAGTGQLDLLSVVFVMAALLVRGSLMIRRRQVVIPERWTSYLTLAYVAFYLVDFFLISRSFLSSTVHLVMFGMVVKVFSWQRSRDHLILAILSFAMVLAAAVLTVDSTFLFAFSGFLLMGVTTFVLMEMKRSAAAATIPVRDSGDPSARKQLALSVAGAGPALLLLILLGATAIFFVLPRISAGYLGAYSPGNDLATGFSDSVRLGRIGEIQQSNSVVMHVQIDNDAQGAFDLKWRGVSLSAFDGQVWTNPTQEVVLHRMGDGRYFLAPPNPKGQGLTAPAAPGSTRIHYRVLMEPIGTNVFFLADKPFALSGDYRMVTMDSGGAIYDVDRDHPIGVFEADSYLPGTQAARLRAAAGSVPPGVELSYLQLPRLDPRIPQLAREVTGTVSNDYDRAAALELYLTRNYGYTLQLSRTTPKDPLAAFLFERRQGHCEYFASAMAVMLRTLNIPSRIVNGFRGGQFNDLTSQYVIRARDAHSWVEAYFPGEGWVSFDPTPSASLPTRGGWDRVALYLDALASFWREWVVNYDTSHQQALGEEAARGSRSFSLSVRDWAQKKYEGLLQGARSTRNALVRSPWRWSRGPVALLSALALLGSLPRLWRWVRDRRLALHPEKQPAVAASIWFGKMTRTLARRGWPKRVAQTPQEFVVTIDDAQIRQRVEKFIPHYERARFGDSTEDARQLPELYQEIKASSRR